ncbi:hypothetical protein SAY86_011225 [Trapa natans]|uniref:Uncharacterized protein n=1 Tax=Trapa natans TaxID=22666 RepID=A0AAN7LIJ6_TRANT|nr:hypothetical protein SAY86_011225 [Trapa natans]
MRLNPSGESTDLAYMDLAGLEAPLTVLIILADRSTVMANILAQFQTIKSSSDRIVISAKEIHSVPASWHCLIPGSFSPVRTMAVHFADPFHVSTRVADKCNDGTLLLQVDCL